MFFKILKVKPEDDFVLSVIFTDGVKRKYDVKPLFEKWPVFKMLKEVPGLYNQVRVDPGGYGISWNDEIDLESNEIRENGQDII